ncbi:MAG: O-antigen translocase, WzxE [Burkholderiales bacterium]|jgi:PST family polysaccharide transporter|nr:O-antigen translocase, WzxE [Burkholderiales bacterium]
MKLIPAISWSALATVVSLTTGFISIKVIAVLIGPFGVALVGQLSNFIQIVMSIALGGASLGLIKYTSQFKDSKVELCKIWGTTAWIAVATTVVITFIMLLLHNYLALTILHNKKYGIIFIVFAFSLIIYVANYLVLNILNGMHHLKRFNILNMLNSILNLAITVTLVYLYNIFGALLALVTSQLLIFLVIMIVLVRSGWFKDNGYLVKFDRYYFYKLIIFASVSIVAVCSTPISEMLIRNYLINNTTWQVAGYWQGLQKISDNYLMVVYAILGTYFLPKLASLENKQYISKEINNGYKVIMPFVIGGAILIYLLRDLIIKILFTNSFSAMRDMFFWQFLGDCFKVAGYIFACLMLAKEKTRIFFTTEIIFSITYIILAYIFIPLFSGIGVVIAFCLNYFLYFSLFIILYKKGYLF